MRRYALLMLGILLILGVLLLCGVAAPRLGHAQTPAPLVFAMPHDKVPNFAHTPTLVSAKAGAWSDPTTWLPARFPAATDIVLVQHRVAYDSMTGDVDTLGITTGGTLVFSTTVSTQLRVVTLLVLPQGTLEIGTPTQPIPPAITATVIIKDQAPNTTQPTVGVFDPAQYGTGLLSIDGRITMVGATKAPTFARLTQELHARDTILTLDTAPEGWQVGDVVVLPDSRQLTQQEMAPALGPGDIYLAAKRLISHSETSTIQAITGTTIALTTPLLFNHLGGHAPDGTLVLLPHVGNLTRNITIRSANPQGTRGHTQFFRRSIIDIRYVNFKDLGRTRVSPLDSAFFDSDGVATHIGTNQIGRYSIHMHHLFGLPNGSGQAYQYQLIGNVVDDNPKWGLTVHDSHFGLVQDNVLYDNAGSGIVTEDGSESHNHFVHNFVVRSEGLGDQAVPFPQDSGDADGILGACYWFRGPQNHVVNNVAANCREGFTWYTGVAESGPSSFDQPVNIPLAPGVDTGLATQVVTRPVKTLPALTISDNEAYSTSEHGLTMWWTHHRMLGSPPMRNTTLWHTRSIGIYLQYAVPVFDGVIALNEGGTGTFLRQFNNDGENVLSAVGHATVRGYDVAYERSGQLSLAPAWTFENSIFQTIKGFVLHDAGQGNHFGASRFLWNNVRFEALPGHPLRSLTLVHCATCIDRDPGPIYLSLYGYQGDFQANFAVYYPERDTPVKPCTDTTTHPEIVGGVTCPISAMIPAEALPPDSLLLTPLEGASVQGNVPITVTVKNNLPSTAVDFRIDGWRRDGRLVSGIAPGGTFAYAWDATEGGTMPCLGPHPQRLQGLVWTKEANLINTTQTVWVTVLDPPVCPGSVPPPPCDDTCRACGTVNACGRICPLCPPPPCDDTCGACGVVNACGRTCPACPPPPAAGCMVTMPSASPLGAWLVITCPVPGR